MDSGPLGVKALLRARPVLSWPTGGGFLSISVTPGRYSRPLVDAEASNGRHIGAIRWRPACSAQHSQWHYLGPRRRASTDVPSIRGLRIDQETRVSTGGANIARKPSPVAQESTGRPRSSVFATNGSEFKKDVFFSDRAAEAAPASDPGSCL